MENTTWIRKNTTTIDEKSTTQNVKNTTWIWTKYYSEKI